MSKRKGSPEEETESAPKRPKINAPLVDIYERLADEAEETRIQAAHDLLAEQLPSADGDTTRQILRRLFRGLCSSRKAARAGFYIALASTLAEVRNTNHASSTLPLSEILDILETETKSDGLSTGQDERDHQFGRLFGSKAMIDSRIMFDSSYLSSWRRLLDFICGIAVKKPWLRQECGWTLYSCIVPGLKELNLAEHAIAILEVLEQSKLMRTPEGVAIWMEVQNAFPKAKLPKNIWKGNSPLSTKDAQTLGTILKESGSRRDAEVEVQARTTWNAQLHFVWEILLKRLYNQGKKDSQQLDFVSLWQIVVDQGIFALSSSAERKHLGLLLLRKNIEEAPLNLIQNCFTPNIVSCLIKSFKASGPEQYIQRTAQTVINAMLSSPEKKRLPAYISGLLKGCAFADFDAMTKTKTIERLLAQCDSEGGHEVAELLLRSLRRPGMEDSSKATNRRRLILNLHQRILNQTITKILQEKEDQDSDLDVLGYTLNQWLPISRGFSPPMETEPVFDDIITALVKEKLSQVFESILKLGHEGNMLFLATVSHLEKETFVSDETIQLILKAAWARFKTATNKLESTPVLSVTPSETLARSKAQRREHASISEGVTLLYGLLLYQIYTGDTEAITIVQDLLDIEADEHLESEHSQNADQAVEILLSFASRPSKFLRRIILLIFEALAPYISSEGLKSLTDVLGTKETMEGQQELFEPGDDGVEGDEEGGEESDADGDSEVDSDVEVLSASEAGASSDGSDSEGSSDDDSEDNEDNERQDAASEALEKALASALGTRKLTAADADEDDSTSSSSSGSDSDMTDSEMLALDSKLAEVFRNRVEQTSTQQSRKKDMRSAKENIVNFKNRVLDMVDVYLHTQTARPDSLLLIMPLMELSRTTKTKQISTRALDILKQYAGRSKGPKMPTIPTGSDDKTIYTTMLSSIHTEITLPDASNALISAANQANILLNKVLLAADILTLEQIVVTVHALKVNLTTSSDDLRTAHQEFFVNFDAWIATRTGAEPTVVDIVQQNALRPQKRKRKGKTVSASKVNGGAVDSLPAKAGVETKTKKHVKSKKEGKKRGDEVAK